MTIDRAIWRSANPVALAAGIAFFTSVARAGVDDDNVPEKQSVAVELKSRVEVESLRISLGDIAMCVPARITGASCDELMAVDIDVAPLPGKTGRITRSVVQQILAEEFPGSQVEVLGPESSFVTARSVVLSDEALAEPFRVQMEDLFSGLEGIRFEVASVRVESRPRVRPGPMTCEFAQLDFIRKRLGEPAGTSIMNDLESLLTRVQNGARFNARCSQGDGDAGVFVRFMPRISVERQLPVARHDLPARTTFKVSDATVAWIPWVRSTSNALRDASTVAGMILLRPVRAGQHLMLRDFERPVAVRRGDHVRLVQKNGDLTITGNAVAVSQGSVGESVDVQTVATKKRIRGIIKANGLVEAM